MITISNKYSKLFQTDKNIDTFIVTGGRFSAKSFAVSLSSVSMAADRGHRILYGRYTNVSSSDSTFPEVEEKIKMLDYDDRFDVNINRINGHNGSKIVFKGFKASSGNQTANLKSLKDFSCLIVEEAEEIPDYDTFEKVSLSIRGNTPEDDEPNIKILILNPTSKEHWIFKKFFIERGVQAGFNGVKDNVCYIHTSYLDCIEHVPENIIREFEMMKVNNPKRYDNVVMGGWLDKADGCVFDNWEFGGFDASLPYIFGLDFGYSNDPTALVKCAVHKGNIYLKEYLYKTHLSAEEISDAMRNLGVTNHDLIICDSSEPRMRDFLRKKGFNIRPAKKGQDSVRSGILKLQNYKLIVEGDNLGVELNNYVWNDKKAGVPVDEYNHLIDAVRYAGEKLISQKVGISW